MLCGPGDVNGLKPKSAVVTKCCQQLEVLVLLLETLMSGLGICSCLSEGPTLLQLLLEKQDQHVP